MKYKSQTIRIADKNKAIVSSISRPQRREKDHNKGIIVESIHENFIAQSHTLSIVTRTIAGVVLGTIWAICYKEDTISVPNCWLSSCLIASLVFFLVELLHYAIDSIYYFVKSKSVSEFKEDFDAEEMKKKIEKHSTYSFFFLMIKALLVFILGILFIIGIAKL